MNIEKKEYNSEIQTINRFLCYIPSISIVSWMCMTLYAFFIFGRLPIYGLDPDPSSMSIDWLNFIATIPTFVSILTIPATLILTIDLLINKQQFSFPDKLAIFVSVLSVLLFFLTKFYLTATFEWIMD